MNCSVILCCAFAPRGQQTGTSRPQPRAHDSSLPAPRRSGPLALPRIRRGPPVPRLTGQTLRKLWSSCIGCDAEKNGRSGSAAGTCVNVGPLANAAGGNDPDIQEDPRSVQPGAHPERGAGRLAAGGEHGSVSQTHGPEAAPRVGRVSPRRGAHSRQTPRCPRPHPASSSGSGGGGEPRGAQGASGAAQPLRSRLLLLLVNPQRTGSGPRE